VGGGFVGLEVAENLLHRGMQVAVVEALPQPAQVVLPHWRHLTGLHMLIVVRDVASGREETLAYDKLIPCDAPRPSRPG